MSELKWEQWRTRWASYQTGRNIFVSFSTGHTKPGACVGCTAMFWMRNSKTQWFFHIPYCTRWLKWSQFWVHSTTVISNITWFIDHRTPERNRRRSIRPSWLRLDEHGGLGIKMSRVCHSSWIRLRETRKLFLEIGTGSWKSGGGVRNVGDSSKFLFSDCSSQGPAIRLPSKLNRRCTNLHIPH